MTDNSCSESSGQPRPLTRGPQQASPPVRVGVGIGIGVPVGPAYRPYSVPISYYSPLLLPAITTSDDRGGGAAGRCGDL